MSSPKKVQVQLEIELKKRINMQSPVKYDIEFYIRKLKRLESEYNILQDQLSKLKIKLKRSEDYAMKYEIIFQQNQKIRQQLRKTQATVHDLQSLNQKQRSIIEQKSNTNNDWTRQRLKYQEQIENWKQKYEQGQEKRKKVIIEEKERTENTIKKEINLNKRDFIEKQEQFEYEIRQLKKIVHEKSTIEQIFKNRLMKLRQDKDKEILRLEELMAKQVLQNNQVINQKNNDLDKMRQKFQTMLNFQIQNLKKNQEDQGLIFQIEINGLRQMIALKNDEISQLLSEIKRLSKDHEKDRDIILNQNSNLKEKFFIIDKQSQLQLFNLSQRLTKLHAQDLSSIEKHNNEIINTLKQNRSEMQLYVKKKDKIWQDEKKQLEQNYNDIIHQMKQRQVRIKELQDKLKDTGNLNASEMKNVHESIHKIETEKQSLTNDYQVNIGFLTQQIAKLTSSNELKNSQITKLQQDLHEIKINYQQLMKDIESKLKKQRKQRQEQQQKQKNLRQALEEEKNNQERQWKLIEKKLQRERQKEQRQKHKCQYMIEQLEKDVKRLNEYIKRLDDNLKRQMKKNQLSTMDIGGVRRQLLSELEKQKSQLETVKRMEVDQITKKYEIQMARLNHNNEKLQTDLLNKSLAYENIEGQFKKLEHINKNIDKINRQKLIDYEKKMATLNSEINLTQNLYEAFIQAKSRANK